MYLHVNPLIFVFQVMQAGERDLSFIFFHWRGYNRRATGHREERWRVWKHFITFTLATLSTVTWFSRVFSSEIKSQWSSNGGTHVNVVCDAQVREKVLIDLSVTLATEREYFIVTPSGECTVRCVKWNNESCTLILPFLVSHLLCCECKANTGEGESVLVSRRRGEK